MLGIVAAFQVTWFTQTLIKKVFSRDESLERNERAFAASGANWSRRTDVTMAHLSIKTMPWWCWTIECGTDQQCHFKVSLT